MTTIITRSALCKGGLAYQGKEPPPELHSIVSDHRGRRIVTWDEVLEARRERQRKIMWHKTHVERWRAVKLWVAYFDQDIFGGWQAMMDGIDRMHHVWIDRDGRGFRETLMALFPQQLPLWADSRNRWEEWKPLFAAAFAKRRQCRRPVGVVYLWRRDNEIALRPR